MNCREEFLEHVDKREVLCAQVEYEREFGFPSSVFRLPVGYSLDDANDFLYRLNFEYDNGYGSQELYGMIWYTDGSWSERAEYDGSEWWAYKKCPEIPSKLQGVNV
jgi:hypothetical protein